MHVIYMMPAEELNNFRRLLFHLICADCEHKEDFHLLLGDLFNIEGNIILYDVDLINLSHRSCWGCKGLIYLEFRKLFSVEQIRRLFDGICLVEKEQTED